MEEVQQQLAEETERHKRSHEADMALLKAEHDEAAAKLHAEHQLQMQKLHALAEGAGGGVEQTALEQLEAAMKERDALQEKVWPSWLVQLGHILSFTPSISFLFIGL